MTSCATHAAPGSAIDGLACHLACRVIGWCPGQMLKRGSAASLWFTMDSSDLTDDVVETAVVLGCKAFDHPISHLCRAMYCKVERDSRVKNSQDDWVPTLSPQQVRLASTIKTDYWNGIAMCDAAMLPYLLRPVIAKVCSFFCAESTGAAGVFDSKDEDPQHHRDWAQSRRSADDPVRMRYRRVATR